MTTPSIAQASTGLYHVFVRDLVLLTRIGIYPHEHVVDQRVRINVDLGVRDELASIEDSIGSDGLVEVVDYEKIAAQVRLISSSGHTRLVETLAERIAEACLTDMRVQLARVRVEKLDVFKDALSAGVEIERRRKPSSV